MKGLLVAAGAICLAVVLFSPADRIKPPKRASVERQAYAPDVIEQLRMAQPTLREQIAVRLLGRLGLRKNELRLLRVKDFDLTQGTFIVHGKGGKPRAARPRVR